MSLPRPLPGGPAGCVLYAASVQPLTDPELYAAAYALASPLRREKTDRLRLERDRRLSLGAEALLRLGLRAAGQDFPREFILGPYGKPYLPGKGLFFSLSHSGEWVLCALGRQELGCDVECRGEAKLRLARRCFHPEELADILRQPTEPEQQALFYRYWTLKESFLKATGRGLSLPLNEFCIRREGGLRVVQRADSRDFRFREFDAIPGCAAALCAAGPAEAELVFTELTGFLSE